MAKRSERASLHPPSILTYGPPTASSSSFILLFFSDVREISSYHPIILSSYHRIMVLVFEHISLEISTTKRSERSERASLHPPSILTYGPPTATS